MTNDRKKTSRLENSNKKKKESYEKKSRNYSFGFLIDDY